MIFTERQITVHKGKSSINEPVILYRGDFEVSIKFTIMESKFRFKSGVNLVDTEKASFGQLAILAPYGGNVFSEVVKCEDGTVTFTLTKEMIDQLEEVGLYSFQIRLFDYYRESRVSIPPVEFGIEVREPVASEDHDNTVNNAIVGYSIAKVVDPSKEDVGDTFNDGGQYNKTDWETGDRISEGKLNKIEDAIDKINQNEKNDVAALNRTVTSNYNVLNSTKSDISYVDNKISAVVSGSPKGSYPTVAALTSAKPKGDNNIYVVTADGHWYYWSGSAWTSGGVYQSVLLEDGSVRSQHIQGINSYNIYTKDTIRTGYVNSGGNLDTTTNGTAYAKIPVQSSHTYILGRANISQSASVTRADPFMVLNSNDEKIVFSYTSSFYAGTDKNGVRYMKYTIPEDGAFLCFNLWISAFDARESTYCIDAENIIEPIEDIKALDAVYTIFNMQVSDEQVREEINDFKESIKTISRDIYKHEAVIYEDQYADLSGTTSKAVGWKRAEIPIKPNSIYSVYFPSAIYNTDKGNIGFLDQSKTKVGMIRWDALDYAAVGTRKYAIIPTPDEAVYISFSIAAGQSLNYYYDDVEGTIFVEGNKILDTDFIDIIETINGKPLFTPQNFDEYVTLPKVLGTGGNNLLRSSDTLIKEGELYNSSGGVQIASGWTRAVIPVTSGTTYYFHSPSGIYSTKARGKIMLLDSKTDNIMQIEGQNTEFVYTNNDLVAWQIINTTSETSYIGLTVGNPAGTMIDFEEGVFQESYPVDGDETPSLISVNGFKVQSNSIETSHKYNMFAAGSITENCLYDNSGDKENASGWKLIDIPVTGGNTYYFYSPSQIYNTGRRGAIVLLDSSKNIIQNIEGQNTDFYTPAGSSNKWQIVTTTSDTFYVGISIKSNLLNSTIQYDDTESGVFIVEIPQLYHEQEYVMSINNAPLYSAIGSNNSNNSDHPLKNKKWVVVGDSLTEFNNRATKNYHHWVAEETGVIVHNMGASGAGYMKRQGDGNAFYQRITKIPTDADIITIFGSGNDLSLTLGTPSDTGTDTICGCMHATFQALFEVMPGAKVGVVLPCPWGAYPPSVEDNKMALYCEALKEIAGQYSIPVLDLYHGSNLRPWDTTFRDLYYKHDDGNTVHPDEDGHKILSNKFKMFIQSL